MNQQNKYEPSNFSLYLQQALRPINKRYFYSKYVNSLPLKPGHKVLEFGAGVGAMAELLARRLSEGELTCVDISGRYLSKARKNLKDYPNTTFYHGKLTKFDINDDHYDAINVHFVLHSVAKENRARLVTEMYELLKPGGRVYLREPLKLSHGLSANEVNELFISAGFIPIYENEKKVRFKGETFSACYSKLATIKFFLC